MTSEPEKLGDAIADTLATIARMQAAAEARERDNPELVAQREAEERAQVIRAASDALRDNGVPMRVVRMLAEGELRETSAVAKIRAWHKARSWCMVLGGSFGVGKSVAAAYWLWTLAIEAAESKRVSSFRAPECWRSAAELARIGNYDRAAFQEAARLPALVIDDLGAEYNDGKGSFLSFVGDLLNERQSNERRTLITTNLKGAEFKERYGQRIIERIREGGVYEGVVGPNLREGHQLSLDGFVPGEQDGVAKKSVTVRAPKPGASRYVARYTARREQYRASIRSPRAMARGNQLMFLFA